MEPPSLTAKPRKAALDSDTDKVGALHNNSQEGLFCLTFWKGPFQIWGVLILFLQKHLYTVMFQFSDT